jgi:APA family basic amino acid/polyamine antiporter
MAVAVVVGNVIGSGIFAKPGTIAAEAGSFPLILLAWVTGGALCALGALCFAELATMLPRAGGMYVYLREAYGKPIAFLFGWNELLFNRPASIGALSWIFVGSLAQALHWQVETTTRVLLAMILIAGLTWVNVIGVIWGGRVQGATTLIKATFLGLLAILPFLMWPFAESTIDVANYSSTIQPPDGTPTWRFGVILLAVMWAYNGWHGITPVAEEVRNPQKNIPRALFGGVGLLTLLYISANVAYHGVLSMEQMAASGEHAAEVMVQELLNPLVGPVGGMIMSGVVMCSVFGAINSNLLIAPRIAFAMGRDGIFFRQLGWIHATYRTPAVAIVVQAVMAVLLVVTSAVLVECAPLLQESVAGWPTLESLLDGLDTTSIFNLLSNFVIFAVSIFYALAALAVVVLRYKHPEWPRPYRTWGYPVVPLLFVGFYVWFLGQVYLGKPLEANAGLVLILLGLPVYYAWQRREEKLKAES